METKIKILILEHDLNDIGLLQYHLNKSELPYTSELVQTKLDYEYALSSIKPDIILSDFTLPAFDGLSAFKIMQAILPGTPFIIVSGTIGDENAVELIKMGVTDYVLKEKLYQIGPKIQRALKEAEDRKQKEITEQQLRQREEHLQKIMDLSLDLIWSLDQDGKFVTVNTASKLILDYLPEELIGESMIDLVHEEDKERTRQAITNLSYEIDILNFENRFIRKSGTPITLLWSARWDHHDKVAYCVAKDITYIKKAEEKIKNNEKKFRTLLQNSTEGYSLIAADGTVIERSLSSQKIFGADASETLGKFRIDLIHPDDFSAAYETFAQIQNKPNDILTVEYRFLMLDGSYKWLEITLFNQLEEPAVGAIVLNFRDITERKIAEIALEKSEEKYRNLFNLSPIPMWVFDVETLAFLDVNEAAIRHYGYSNKEFLSMTLKDIRPIEDVKELGKALRESRLAGGSGQSVFKHVKKNGETIHVEVHNSPLELDGNETRMVLALDISEQLKYTQAIEHQNEKLREIAWTQSHVVRAPVARIMGLANLLSTCAPEKGSTKELLNSIQISAKELDTIIRGIVKKTEQVKDHPILGE